MWINGHLKKVASVWLLLWCFSQSYVALAFTTTRFTTVDWTVSIPTGKIGLDQSFIVTDDPSGTDSWETRALFGPVELALPFKLPWAAALLLPFVLGTACVVIVIRTMLSGRSPLSQSAAGKEHDSVASH
jgi:hypothetical protein